MTIMNNVTTCTGSGHIVRMQFEADAFSNDKMLLQSINDFFQTGGRKCRRSAAKIEAGDRLLFLLASCAQVDFFN